MTHDDEIDARVRLYLALTLFATAVTKLVILITPVIEQQVKQEAERVERAK